MLIKILGISLLVLFYAYVRIKQLRAFRKEVLSATRFGIIQELVDTYAQHALAPDHEDIMDKKHQELERFFISVVRELKPGSYSLTSVFSLMPITPFFVIKKKSIRDFVVKYTGKTAQDLEDMITKLHSVSEKFKNDPGIMLKLPEN